VIHTKAFCFFSHSFLFITASREDYLSFREVGNEAVCEQRGIIFYIMMRKPTASFDFSTSENPCKEVTEIQEDYRCL